jgi:hypothetical protein
MSILLLAQPEPIAEFPEILGETDWSGDFLGLGLFAETDQLAEETESLAGARRTRKQALRLQKALQKAVHETSVTEVHQS